MNELGRDRHDRDQGVGRAQRLRPPQLCRRALRPRPGERAEPDPVDAHLAVHLLRYRVVGRQGQVVGPPPRGRRRRAAGSGGVGAPATDAPWSRPGRGSEVEGAAGTGRSDASARGCPYDNFP